MSYQTFHNSELSFISYVTVIVYYRLTAVIPLQNPLSFDYVRANIYLQYIYTIHIFAL